MPALPAEPNKIDGACACGVAVPAGAGFFVRKALKLQCAACRSVDLAADAAPVPAAPVPAAPVPAAPARTVTPSLPMLLPPDDGKVKVRIYWNEKAQKAVVTVSDASSRLTIEAVMRACEAHSFVHTPGLGGWAGHVESVPRLIAGLSDAGLRSEVSDNASRAMLARAEQNKRAVAGASLRVVHVGRRGRTLKEYQKRGIEFMAPKDVALNADDGGLGKTAQLLNVAGPRPRIMVIAPKIMVGAIVKGRPIGGWADEAAIWRPDIERFTIIETRDEFRWPEENEIVALNFELMPVSPAELAKEATKNAEARRSALSKGVPFQEPPKKNHKVADMPPEGVELFGDEVHAFANPNSQRSKRFKHLASMVLKRKGRVRGASATPMKNNAKELYAVLDALGAAERVFGTYEAYARLHDYRPRQVAKDRVTWEFNDPSPMVAEKLKQVMIRRKKRDVLTELPPLTFRRLVVEVDRETIKACDAAMKEIERAGLDVEKAMEIVNESRTGGFDFDKISGALAALAKVKTPHALERADEFERTGTPVVFFAAHLPVVETLGKRRGWGTLVGGDAATANYDGEPLRAKGPEIARAFQSGRLDNIAATIQYAGVGITLTRASHALLVEKVWNPAAVAQAIWRIERIGQENSMVVTDMVANHPLDVRMSEVLEKKLDLYAATVDAAAVAVNDLDRREDVVSGLVQAAAKTARKPG